MTTLETLIWVLFAATQLADIRTTNIALSHPGIKEAHPIWRRIQDRFGRFWWVPRLIAGAAMGIGLWWVFGSIIPVAIVTILIGGVAIWNSWVIWTHTHLD